MARTEASSFNEASALLEFVRSLPDEDFDNSPQRYYAVQDLLFTLLDHGQWPEHPGEFKTLLAPIVCSGPEQQQQFYELFENWARQRAREAGPQWLPPEQPRSVDPEREEQRARRKRILIALIGVLLVVAAAGAAWFKWVRPSGEQSNGSGPSNSNATQSHKPVTSERAPAAMIQARVRFLTPVRSNPTELDTAAIDPQTGDILTEWQGGVPNRYPTRSVSGAGILANGHAAQSGLDGTVVISLPANVRTRYLVTHNDYKPVLGDYFGQGDITVILMPPGIKPAPRPPALASWRIRHRDAIRAGAAALPFAVLAAWWVWILIRRLALRKWDAKPTKSSLRLSGRSGITEIVPKDLAREVAREMCRRVPRASRKLAAAATANATAKNAGYFSPVFAEVRAAQEYVVLIENSGARDQQAHLATELVSLLEAHGASLTAYYYTGDPRICTEVAPSSQAIILEELIARHPGHVLWVIGGVRAFVDPVTGEAAAWAGGMSSWQRRFIFDSGGPESLRTVLMANGFTVLPLDVAAIRAAVSVTTEDGESRATAMIGGALPDLLSRDWRMLFANESPSEDDTARLLSATRRFLGSEAYDAFCACALLPQFSFGITLCLVRDLVGKEIQYDALQRIVRTPWMRFGRMPDWLRQRLIRRLPPQRMEQALASLKTCLETIRPIVKPAATGRAASIEFSRPTGRERKTIGMQKDFIFLGALWGLQPDQLAAPAPSRLSRLLFRHGYAMFGLQPWLHLAAACSLSAALWAGTARATQPPAPKPGVQEDAFLRRIREVAQSQIGATQNEGRWRSPFADWVADQAAQLLGTATPLLSPSFDTREKVIGLPDGIGIALGMPSPVLVGGDEISASHGTVLSVKGSGLVRGVDLRPADQPARNIAVISTSSKVSYDQIVRFVAVLQTIVAGDLQTYWGVKGSITAYRNAAEAPSDAWRVTIQDKLDQPGMVSYHSDNDGVPFARILADSSIYGIPWSLAASHEAFEMLVDPFGARFLRGPAFTDPGADVLRTSEICDPVQGKANARTIDGFPISDFVFPRWFYDPAALPGERYDREGRITAPRQIVDGGYSLYIDPANNHWYRRSLLQTPEKVEDLGHADGRFDSVRNIEVGPTGVKQSSATPAKPSRPNVILIVPYPGAEDQDQVKSELEKLGYKVEISSQAANHQPDEGMIDYFLKEDRAAAREIEAIARKNGWQGSGAALDTNRNFGHLIQVWYPGK